MKWHVYEIIPIDFGWENLKTVKETVATIAGFNDVVKDIEGVNSSAVRGFLDRWDSAKSEASRKGWEGDFRHDPIVFWLPNEYDFEYGFVFKQENNGTTFVVSPFPLPWLGVPA